MKEEISRPEWDGEAMDRAAEVKRDPEVSGISIHKDVPLVVGRAVVELGDHGFTAVSHTKVQLL